MPSPSSDPPAVILVVDDDRMQRMIARSALDEGAGDRELLEAEDGVEAQAILASRRVDLVVTDLMMPRLDGLGLMRWANEHCPGPDWIVLSGIESFDNAVEATHLGAIDFLPKPLHAETLRLAARNALRQRALEAERNRLTEALSAANVSLEERIAQLEGVCRLLEDQAAMLDRDLAQAEVIQRALLPRESPRLDGFRVDTLYRTGHRVGGDLYDVFPIDEHLYGITIADACGHGVSAAMLCVLFKLHLRTNVREPRSDSAGGGPNAAGPPRSPADLLGLVNRKLRIEVPGPGLFVTSAYGLLDTRAGRLRIASAGHTPILWKPADGPLRRLERTGPALGLDPDARYQERTLDLARGDRLLLYTDGLLDLAGLDETAARFAGLEADAPDAVLEALYTPEVAEGDERDDVTLLLLSATEGHGRQDAEVEQRGRRPSARSEAEIGWGRSGEATFCAIAGRATWTCAADLFEAAIEVVERGDPLVIDLSDCDYLDSTVLGSLHEIVVRGDERDARVRIQGLGEALRPLFEELDMQAVLAVATDSATPRPEMLEPLERTTPIDPRQDRVLRAHETLAGLSAANREQLADVLAALRAELRPSPH